MLFLRWNYSSASQATEASDQLDGALEVAYSVHDFDQFANLPARKASTKNFDQNLIDVLVERRRHQK